MRRQYQQLLVLVLGVFAAASAMATTWNEPWQKQVVQQADSFGLFEVTEVKGLHAKLRTVKTLAGVPTPEKLEIVGDYALQLTSVSEHGEHDLAMRAGQRVYLYPKQDGKKWKLPTPTSGIDPVLDDGNVAATYRISFHQALQEADAYERLQTCVYQQLHGIQCDTLALSEDLIAPLELAPGSLSASSTPDQQSHFFKQHAALEASYLLKRPLPLATLEPFLRSDFFHHQISAVRALSVSDDPRRDARIVAFIKDDTRTGVARGMAIFLIEEMGDQALRDSLKAYKPANPEEDTRLPLNIMDPRIGTSFPGTLQSALDSLR